MNDTIRVNKGGLQALLSTVDTGGFWSNELGIGYIAGPGGVMNVMVETDEHGFPRTAAAPGPVSPSAENPTWGTCVGEAQLCDGGTVKDDPRYTCGYQCTGGKHVAAGQYVRCTDASHRPAVIRVQPMIVNLELGGTSAAPVYWAQCGHGHAFGVACSVSASAR